MTVIKPQRPTLWFLWLVRSLGKKILSVNQGGFKKMSQSRNESLLVLSEGLFDASRTEYSTDTNVLDNMLWGISQQKEYTLREVTKYIRKAPGYFLVNRDGKNRGHSAVETQLRIHNYLDTLSKIRLVKTDLSPEHFMELQAALDSIEDLIYGIEKAFSSETIQIDGNIKENIIIGDVFIQNAIWLYKTLQKILGAQKQLSDFFNYTLKQGYFSYRKQF